MGAEPRQFEAALAAWQAVLGPERADARPETIARHARTTAPEGHAPACVLSPRTRDEVVTILRIANEHRVPVHPIARGKNWGYGDASPARAGVALIDLSGMNRILEIDGESGYAVIEPGVSQGELYEALQRDAPKFWMDSTGAGPGASVVGNALQRGFGHTAYADHVRSMCGLEVVLADGRVLNTGFGRFEGARAARHFPYGLGPYLDGIFTQSNFGIVTKMGLWLQPKPAAFRFFWIRVADERALERLVEALRPLRLSGVLRSAVHIGNDLRVISAARAYPWEEAHGATPLPEALRARLRAAMGCGAWNVSGSLVGSEAEVGESARALRRAIAGIGKIVFLDDMRLNLIKRAAAFMAKLGRAAGKRQAVQALDENYSLLQGRPTNGPLKGMLWRVRERGTVAPEDLLDTHAGLLWAAPVAPLRGSDARNLLDIAQPILARHGFDLLVTFTMLNERSMVCIINVSFDKTLPAEVTAAAACHAELKAAFAAQGYYPYRESSLGHDSWSGAGQRDVFNETTQAIKRALDPNGILSPGLYVPRQGD